MAGVVGLVHGNKQESQLVEKMLSTVNHRGADSREMFEDTKFSGGVCAQNLGAKCASGFARHERIVCFFDGEIYNEREEGKTDAEVVIDLFLKYGRAFPGHCKGVFACALWNGAELLLARDSVGVRPLFYGRTEEGGLAYASEMKALLGVVTEAEELKPSTVLSSEFGINGYVVDYPEMDIPSDPAEAAKKLRNLLVSSVERRLADGAVGGMLLSGGLDSSVIVAIAHQFKPDIPAYTVALKGGDAPDLENAALMAEHLGIELKQYLFSPEEIAALVEDAVWKLESFDEDCISGALSNLHASSLASKDTNCIFSGEGGDELFGGYHLLKELPTEYERLKMMHKLVDIAYNTAVQRLDRGMFGNSLNYRTPFIDTDVIAFALQIPVRWKIHKNGEGRLIEKWILREACRDLLPDKIYKRVKLRFSAGTGTDTVMDQIARDMGYDKKFDEKSRRTPGGYYLNSPKELWYYEIFKEKFPGLSFEKLVGRWDPNK